MGNILLIAIVEHCAGTAEEAYPYIENLGKRWIRTSERLKNVIDDKNNWAKYGFRENDEVLIDAIKQVLDSNEKAKEDIRNGPDTYPKTETEQPEEFKKPKTSKK